MELLCNCSCFFLVAFFLDANKLLLNERSNWVHLKEFARKNAANALSVANMLMGMASILCSLNGYAFMLLISQRKPNAYKNITIKIHKVNVVLESRKKEFQTTAKKVWALKWSLFCLTFSLFCTFFMALPPLLFSAIIMLRAGWFWSVTCWIWQMEQLLGN